MLRMAQINHIKELYEKQEKSLREIARITGHSFATVQKYAYRDDWNQESQLKVKEQNYPILKAIPHKSITKRERLWYNREKHGKRVRKI